DRIRAAGIIRPRDERIVAAFAVLAADRMDRREIEDVEAHRADRRQPADHVVERAMTTAIVRLAAREELVPAREARGAPLDVDDELVRAREEFVLVDSAHR